MKKVLFIVLVIITFGALISCSKESDDFTECEWLMLESKGYYEKNATCIYECQSKEDPSKYIYISEVEWLSSRVPEGYQSLRIGLLIIEAPYINFKTSTFEIRYEITGRGAIYTPGDYEGENKSWKSDAKDYIKNHYKNYGVSGKLGNEYQYKLAVQEA